ncbi:hypothetical protein [Phenylobacterium sp.]|uniref:hypothetical protein n=1 Tax=Phenylobacterium sp. TaxID=1871053 RepID=UPI00286D8385|nr:hypothetical protein [Phenylobacterium sp.]
MNRSRLINTAIWVLVAVCVTLGIATAISYRRLQDQVTALRSEAAMLQANKAITRTAFTDLQDLLRQPIETPQQTCARIVSIRDILHGMTSRQREALGDDSARLLTLATNSCATLEGGLLSPDYRATRKFVDAYIEAVSARVVGDYAIAGKDYDRALAVDDIETVDAQWRIRALEGSANARMHLKDYASARARLADLASLRAADNAESKTDYRFVFEGITQIKLMCLEKKPATEVSASLTQLRSDFDAYEKTRSTPELRKFAAADRLFIEQDAELYQTCDYAKLSPVKVGG